MRQTSSRESTTGSFFSARGRGMFKAVHFAGCTSIVRPNVAESEFLSTSAKKQGRADLYATEQFQSHTETKTDVMDFKKWQFELGPVAVDTFKYTLATKYQKVEVKLGNPSFPLSETESGDLLVVIEPAFDAFSSHCPFLFKFETYVVKVSFRVKAYDKAGKVIVDQVYEGEGKKRGSCGFESAGLNANPEASRMAIKDASSKAVEDIISKTK